MTIRDDMPILSSFLFAGPWGMILVKITISDHGGKMVSGHRVPQVVVSGTAKRTSQYVSRPDRRKMRCPVIAYRLPHGLWGRAGGELF